MLTALADAYLDKSQYAQAAAKYQQLLSFKISNKHIYKNLCKAFVGLNRSDSEALRIYQKAIHNDPGSEICGEIAHHLFQHGNKDSTAVWIYERAAAIDSDISVKLAEFLAAFYFKRKEFVKCKNIAKKILTKSRYHAKLLNFYLKSAWKTHQYDDAILLLKRLIDTTNDNSFLLKQLCRTYLESNFHDAILHGTSTLSYIDRQLILQRITQVTQFERLQDISEYLELRRLLFENEKNLKPMTVEARVGYENITIGSEQTSQEMTFQSFDMKQEVLEKLNFQEALSSHVPHSQITYDDFQEKGAELFSEEDFDQIEMKVARDAEIVIIIEICSKKEKSQRKKFSTISRRATTFITALLSQLNQSQFWTVRNGLLIFTDDLYKSIDFSLDLLNRINRYNFIAQDDEEIHLAIGIHHARNGLQANDEQSFRDLNTGIKVAIASNDTLSYEDKIKQGLRLTKGNRIFLSGKAFREIKSSKRFRINNVGQFKLKYLKESLVIHEVDWKKPINDLKLGLIDKLDRFNFISELSNTGPIRTYKAKDSSLQRFVILKVIQSKMFANMTESDSRKIKLLDLLKSQAQMNQANMANVYEIDESRGLTYIVREYVDGVPLTKIFANHNSFDCSRVLRILNQLCRALQTLHGFGQCHLNLKPNNIIVGFEDQVKMMDPLIPDILFGDDSNGISEGNKKLYISPEQIGGGNQVISEAIFFL